MFLLSDFVTGLISKEAVTSDRTTLRISVGLYHGAVFDCCRVSSMGPYLLHGMDRHVFEESILKAHGFDRVATGPNNYLGSL